MLRQIIILRWEEFEFFLNRQRIVTNLEVALTAGERAKLSVTLEGYIYDVFLANDELVRHIFFTDNRSIADVQKAQVIIRAGDLGRHTQIIKWDRLPLEVSGVTHYIDPVTTITGTDVTLSFKWGRRTINLRTTNLNLLRHIGAVTGKSADSSLQARRYI